MLCIKKPLCFLVDGSSSHGLDGMLSYSSLPRQQLLALDPNLYGGEQFRHGLTPPQLGPEQMHPYGTIHKSYIFICVFLFVCLWTETLFMSVVLPLTCYTFLYMINITP